jgi:hypothetical protein
MLRPGQAKGPNVAPGSSGTVVIPPGGAIIFGTNPPTAGDWKIYTENGFLKFARWDDVTSAWIEAGGALVDYLG